MNIVLRTFWPLLVSNWATMADEDIGTHHLDLQKDLDSEELSRKTDIPKLRAS